MLIPRVHLLWNGRYRVLVSDAGVGASLWEDVTLTRWTGERGAAEGVGFYLRDRDHDLVWSPASHPVRGGAPELVVDESPGRVAVTRRVADVTSRLEVAVDPDADVEYRVLTLRNHTTQPRALELTTYVEVALNDPAADAAHPVFSKLFVETAVDAGAGRLLARRRRRSRDDPERWMGHALWIDDGAAQDAEFETDRARFIGRGRTLRSPGALAGGAALSGTHGYVLDPMLGLRRSVRLVAGASVRLIALVAAGAGRDTVTRLLDPSAAAKCDAVLDAARRAAEHRIPASLVASDRARLPALTGRLLFGRPPHDPAAALPAPSDRTLADLAALGVAPDAPLVLARLRTADDRETLARLAPVVGWWRASGLAVQLLVLEDGVAVGTMPLPDGAVVRPASEVPPELTRLAHAAARLTLAGFRDPAPDDEGARPPRAVTAPLATRAAHDAPARDARAPDDLQLWNGYGGFTRDGSEYVIRMEERDGRPQLPPRPWANVIANASVGCLVTERGSACTWSVNSRENRLTPWSNDPVTDPTGEALYVRDDTDARYWSPLPAPTPGRGAYEARHGFGYSVWRHRSGALDQETTVFVPPHDPLKITRIRVTNVGTDARRLSVYAYLRLVLGDRASTVGRFVVCEHDAATGAVLATNPYRGATAGRVAFACLAPPGGTERKSWTADRDAFLGAAADTVAPAAVVEGAALDGRAGAGLDPCAAFHAGFTLEAGETATAVLLLGEAEDREAALALCRRYADGATVRESLDETTAYWRDLLGHVRVDTPSPALDLMVNGWLGYQALSCRVWGRTAFYQSGGAFGFRDQLQDVTALMWHRPTLARTQVLLHAAHQFPDGGVLHWWHPPDDRGLRTRFADDPVWLPFVALEYVRHTGDAGVFDESVPFIEAPALERGEAHRLVRPRAAGEEATLYEHCCRALDRSLTQGPHGLPLIRGGDWNDGMDRVGWQGRGESVWLGFFLVEVLQRFVPLCDTRGETTRAAAYRAYLAALRAALQHAGWDGDWYRRAYYDDGEPLGSAAGEECRIDAIAQAWSVLSGAAPVDRATSALDAVERLLVDRDAGLIRLLTPPFDRTRHDPGYIKGYVPGVRENGGQYTHGVLWFVRAMAAAGREERAAPLLEMLSPVHHTANLAAVDVYQAEPYAIAADIYGAPPHVGRAGWTWYTGSAGWMFRVAVESILGLTVHEGRELVLAPCIPAAWPGFSARYRIPSTGTTYRLEVTQPSPRPARTTAAVDGGALRPADGVVRIPLRDDGETHRVVVTLGDDLRPRYRPRGSAGEPAD